ncbi:MAG TPA: peptidoglycan-binding protein [Candidatus Paceibacterota bacterium]
MKKLLVSAFAVVALVTAAPVLGQSYSYGCVSVPAGLGAGSRGASVSTLQSFLVAQNYPGAGSWMITGYYGQATAAAMRNFQISQGLLQTGYVDAATATAVSRVSCGGTTIYPTYPTYPSYPTYPTYPTSPTHPTYPQQYPYTYPNNSCGGYPSNFGYGYGTNCSVRMTSISPTSADVGERVTIHGYGFSRSGNTVRFGIGTAVSNVSSSDDGTRISFTVPSRLTVYSYTSERVYEATYPVSVANAAGYTSNAISLRITDADDDDNNDDVEIDRVTGPSTLEEGERGTWRVYLEDGSNDDYMTFTVDWDDDNNNYYDPYGYTQNTYNNSASFSHTYYDEGTYKIRFTVRNRFGESDSITKTVEVDNDNDDDDNDEEHISIDDMEFDPDVLHIDRGTRVTWENDDTIDHTVTSLSSYYFASGTLDPGEDYSHTFNTRGTFSYFCSLHPEMRGTIIVD